MNIDIDPNSTREQLYLRLKALSPEAARGHSRSRREELFGLIAAARSIGEVVVPSITEAAPMAPVEPPKEVSLAPKKVKKARSAKKVEEWGPKLTAERAEALRDAYLRVSAAVASLRHSGVDVPQLAALIYLITGVPKETAEVVLAALYDVDIHLGFA